MRRTLSAAAVALLTLGLVLAGSTAASAAEPLPPVTDIPDLPSNTIRMTQGAGGSWTATDWWKYVGWKIQQPGTDVATIPGTNKTVAVVPKPITPGGAVTRVAGGAAGSVLVAGNLGWAIGQGGLVAYSAMTGTDYGSMICTTPDWYQATNSFLMMGVTPDCHAGVADPNGDLPAAGTLSYGAANVQVLGYRHRSGFSYRYQCMKVTGSLPAGYTYNAKDSNSSTWTGGGPGPIGTNTYCTSTSGVYSGGPYPATTHWNTSPLNATTSYRVVRQSDGAVVATMSETKGDPNRTPSCTIGWKDGTTTTGTGTTYKESTGVPLSAPGLGCKSAWDAKPGAGREVMPDRIGVDSTDDTGAKTEISGQNVPDFTPTEKIGLDPTLGNGRGLVLERVINGTTTSCMTWEADCGNWWTETSQGTVTDTYKCTYGGAAVALTECGPYRYTFDAPTSTPTIWDPTTATPQPWPSTPMPQPGSSLGNTTGGGSCGASWSWNPVDWVLNPLKCAFIPSQAKVAAATAQVQAQWATTGPSRMAAAISGLTFNAPGSGCGGIVIDIPWFGHDLGAHRILNACAGDPLAPVATGVSVVLGILAGLGALFAVTRAFGFIVGARGIGEGA